jgi:hypothetical protein
MGNAPNLRHNKPTGGKEYGINGKISLLAASVDWQPLRKDIHGLPAWSGRI